MTRKVMVLSLDASVTEAARLMKKHGIGSVIVVEDAAGKKARGIITERDIVHKLVASGKDISRIKVETIMSKPLRVVTPDASLEQVARAMRKNRIKRLPVVNEKRELVGVVSEGDIMRVFPAVVDLLEERAAALM